MEGEESEASAVESGSEDEDDDDDRDGDMLERELDILYENFQQRREEADAKALAKRARKEKETDEWEGLSDNDQDTNEFLTDAETDFEDEYDSRQLPKSDGLSTKAAMFFDQDIFQDLGIEEDADKDSAIEMDDDTPDAAEPVIAKSVSQQQKPGKPLQSAFKKAQPPQPVGDSRSEPQAAQPSSTRQDDPLTSTGHLDIDIITAEAMTLAHSLATGSTTPRDLADDTFNKYTFRDVDGLPEWFLDDESTHSRPHRPITKAAALAIKEKLRALNARPIKKVREAKGRKKFKAAQRLEKLRKKSALLLEDEGVSEKDKASAITRMMSRAAKKGGKKGKEKVKVVVARGANRGISGRPKGVKGRYKIVDGRLKKDVRAEKRLKKRLKK